MNIYKKMRRMLPFMLIIILAGCAPQLTPIVGLKDIEPIALPVDDIKSIAGAVRFERAVTNNYWNMEVFSQTRRGNQNESFNHFGAIRVMQVRPTLKIGFKSYNASLPVEFIMEFSGDGTLLHGLSNINGRSMVINNSNISEEQRKFFKSTLGSFDVSRTYRQGDIVQSFAFSEFIGTGNVSGSVISKLSGELNFNNRRAFLLDLSGSGMLTGSISLTASGYSIIDSATSLVLEEKTRLVARNQKNEVVAIADNSSSTTPPTGLAHSEDSLNGYPGSSSWNESWHRRHGHPARSQSP